MFCSLWRLFVDFLLEVLPAVGAWVQGGDAADERPCVVLSLLRWFVWVVGSRGVHLPMLHQSRENNLGCDEDSAVVVQRTIILMFQTNTSMWRKQEKTLGWVVLIVRSIVELILP